MPVAIVQIARKTHNSKLIVEKLNSINYAQNYIKFFWGYSCL
jgi:hypothetical protein